jgi:2-polyprenyl-6-methoxyphenol hydroxylase-like FAD-dependent oxidoreductase
MTDTEVLIIGAGPTGLTLACELARRGVDTRIVERSAGPSRGSRGFTLKPRSLDVLAGVGALDRVLAGGMPSQKLRFHLGQERLFDLDPAPSTDLSRPYPNPVGIPQWRTEEALRERLAELGVAVEFGRGLDAGAHAVVADDDGVTAVLAGGETVRARYLVGTDGGRSTVRKAAGIGFPGSSPEGRALIADAELTGLDRAAGTHMWVGPRGVVAARPIPHDDVWQVVVSHPPEGAEQSIEVVQDRLQAVTGRADVRICDPRWMSVWRYNLRMADRYRAGRVLIAGDAAHVHSPFGGHGMNTGIQDAANLGWKLAMVLAGAAGDQLLDTYEAERMPVARAILADSDNQMSAAVRRPKLLGPLLGPVVRAGFARRQRRTRDDHPTYRTGPLTVDRSARRSRVRAGDLAPDAPLHLAGRWVGLHELLREPRLTVLTFGASAPDLEALAGHAQVVEVGGSADPTGALRRAFAATRETVVVVRPDGYVGLLAHRDGARAAADHLATLGAGASASPVLEGVRP